MAMFQSTSVIADGRICGWRGRRHRHVPFQSTSVIADGRIATSRAALPRSPPFQSTSVIADGRIRVTRRLVLALLGFNPRPSLLTDEFFGFVGHGQPSTLFQSTSVIADGRIARFPILSSPPQFVSIHVRHC